MTAWLDISALSRRRSAKFVLAFLVVVAVITLVTFITRAWWGHLGSVAKQDAAAWQEPGARVEAEAITITPRGFEPAEITRPKGPVLLVVNDQTGFWEVALRLDRVTGGRLREVKVHQSKQFWAELFDLNPGQYVLSEADHPGWTCRITITAK